MRKFILFFIVICMSWLSTFAQLAKCKGKYFGNIIQSSVPSNYGTLWNQATSENGSKWDQVERSKGTYSFTNSDIAFNWAKNNGGLFKYHCLVWGSQTASWVSGASTSDIQTGIQNYIKAVANHYSTMGGLKLIDVLNEPVNTAFPGNMKAALTAGYQAEATNASDKNNQYGWAIWAFQLARKAFPDATLLINEYNIEMNWNSCRTTYIAIINAVKNAPNLTDGKKNLIDGVGLQCHSVEQVTASSFKSCIDEIWTKTGLPIHITEFDQEATPSETTQKNIFSTLIPVAWEHPHVAGITLWGYIQGTTWRNGNGTAGPSGTDTGIQYASSYSSNPSGDRPALTWLKTYLASQPSLSCCPAPAPFASCPATGVDAKLTTPSVDTSLISPASITLTATATSTSGTISKVEFYNGTQKLGEDATAPYSFSWSNITAGTYQINVVATDNNANVGTSATINITVVDVFKIYKTPTPITIDGTADAVWTNASVIPAETSKLLTGTVTNAADLSGSFKALWDDTYLYLWADITDDTQKNDSQNAYDDDAVEVYVDMNNAKATAYETDDVQYTFGWNDGTTIGSLPSGRSTTGITYKAVSKTGGYIIEARIPWTTLQGTPSINKLVGIDFMVNDDDDGSGRDAKLSWNSATDQAYQDASLFGTAILKDTISSPCTTPDAPKVVSPINYTLNDVATALTATGTGLKWYTAATGGTALSTAPTPTTTATGTISYYVSQTANTCESNRAKIDVIVSNTPTIKIQLKTGWNIIGYPFNGSADIATALSSVWTNVNTVKDLDSFYDKSSAQVFMNSLTKLEWGHGYMIKVNAPCELIWK